MIKLESFQLDMKELALIIWFTTLRKIQTPNRTTLNILSEDKKYNTIKVSPILYWTDADMEAYLKQHNLPNVWYYFDPAKSDEKCECGLCIKQGSEMCLALMILCRQRQETKNQKCRARSHSFLSN